MANKKSIPFSQETFILRVLIPDDEAQSYRGQIQHVRTGKIFPINQMDYLMPIIVKIANQIEYSIEPNTNQGGENNELIEICDAEKVEKTKNAKGGIR